MDRQHSLVLYTATKFIGDGSDLTGIDASALKFGGVVKAQANGFGVVVTGVTTSSGGFSGNLTGNGTGTALLQPTLQSMEQIRLLYQDSNNDSDVLPTGSAGQILASSGAGAEPQWVTLLLLVRLKVSQFVMRVRLLVQQIVSQQLIFRRWVLMLLLVQVLRL